MPGQEMMKLPGLMVDNGIHSHVISSVFAAQVLEFCCQKKTKADFARCRHEWVCLYGSSDRSQAL